MFPVVLFGISRGWIKVIIFLYCLTLAHGMIKLLVVTPIWYLYSALPSALQFRKYLLETINSSLFTFSPQKQSMGESREDTSFHSFTFPFSSKLLTMAFENFGYTWGVEPAYSYCSASWLCTPDPHPSVDCEAGKNIPPIIHVEQQGQQPAITR